MPISDIINNSILLPNKVVLCLVTNKYCRTSKIPQSIPGNQRKGDNAQPSASLITVTEYFQINGPRRVSVAEMYEKNDDSDALRNKRLHGKSRVKIYIHSLGSGRGYTWIRARDIRTTSQLEKREKKKEGTPGGRQEERITEHNKMQGMQRRRAPRVHIYRYARKGGRAYHAWYQYARRGIARS